MIKHINSFYKILADDVLRGLYLLQITHDKNKTEFDKENILEEFRREDDESVEMFFELNMQIDQSQQQDLLKLREMVEREIRECYRKVGSAFDKKNYEEVVEVLNRFMYYQQSLEKIKNKMVK